MFDVLFTAGPCLLGASMNRVLGVHGQTPFHPGELFLENDSGTSFVTGSGELGAIKIPGRTIILKQNKWDMAAHRFTFVEKNTVVGATDMEDWDDRKNFPMTLAGAEEEEEEEEEEQAESEEDGEVSQGQDVAEADAADGEEQGADEDSGEDEEEGTAEKESSTSGSAEIVDSGMLKAHTTAADAAPEGEHYSKAHAKQGIYGLQNLYVNDRRADEEIKIILDCTRAWPILSAMTVPARPKMQLKRSVPGKLEGKTMGTTKTKVEKTDAKETAADTTVAKETNADITNDAVGNTEKARAKRKKGRRIKRTKVRKVKHRMSQRKEVIEDEN